MNWKETFYTGKREHPQEKKPASLTALLMPLPCWGWRFVWSACAA